MQFLRLPHPQTGPSLNSINLNVTQHHPNTCSRRTLTISSSHCQCNFVQGKAVVIDPGSPSHCTQLKSLLVFGGRSNHRRHATITLIILPILCWFAIFLDGKLLMMTPVDPVFLLIPILHAAQPVSLPDFIKQTSHVFSDRRHKRKFSTSRRYFRRSSIKAFSRIKGVCY